MSNNILIFAGAGASKAINPDRFPTTKEFFDDLPASIKSNQIFIFTLKYLKTIQKLETIDIEHVLFGLQQLYSFYSSTSSSKNIVGYSFQDHLIQMVFPGNSGNIGDFHNLSNSIASQISSLVGEINKIVYDLYGYEPEDLEIEDNWVKLISGLESSQHKLDIFTTNYDVVIEAALNIINGEQTARQIRGIRGAVRQTLDLGRWVNGSEREGLLTKLHGSLDWKIRGDSIYAGDPVFTGDHSKQAIIYPGFKGESDAQFFSVFHEYFALALSECRMALFIGFAFRDDYINRIIRENIRPSCQVILINPDQSIAFPSKRIQSIHREPYFDNEAVSNIVDY